MKRILFYFSHPSQYLFARNALKILNSNGHQLKIVIRTKDVLEELVKLDKVEYINISPIIRKHTYLSIIHSLISRDYELYKIAKEFKPDIITGTDASCAHIAKLINAKCITTLEDDYDVIPNLARITYPFTNTILTPEVCKVGKWESKKIGYNGYMKLGNLHPSYFKPNRSLIESKVGNDPYFIIRLSNLKAYHDFGINGINSSLIYKLIRYLSPIGNVFITTEKPLAADLERYRFHIKSTVLHHLLYYSNMLISDSQSMSVEAAILGTPSIRINDFAGRISVLEELEHTYQLTYAFKPDQHQKMFEKVLSLLEIKDLKEQWHNKRDVMLKDKINITNMLVWFYENYPESAVEIKKDPSLQYKFK